MLPYTYLEDEFVTSTSPEVESIIDSIVFDFKLNQNFDELLLVPKPDSIQRVSIYELSNSRGILDIKLRYSNHIYKDHFIISKMILNEVVLKDVEMINPMSVIFPIFYYEEDQMEK